MTRVEHYLPACAGQLRAAAVSAAPREDCGVLLRDGRIIPLGNRDPDPTDAFALGSFAKLRKLFDVVAIWHTHPDKSKPSDLDRDTCQATWIPWIVAGPTDIWVIYPHVIGYLTREFVYGEEDCWQLCHDWWAWDSGTLFPWFERPPEGWWETPGVSPYLEHAERYGFVAEAWTQASLKTLQRGNILLMQIAGRRPNHAAVYVGGGGIMHHLHGRLSCVELLDDRYQRFTTHVCRYEPCN